MAVAAEGLARMGGCGKRGREAQAGAEPQVQELASVDHGAPP
jgi:hypothetical protein